MMDVQVRPYRDAKDECFGDCGLPDADKPDYEKGWDEQMDEESQLGELTEEDYEAKLGESTEIINFNGLMTLFEEAAHNGKMTEYVISQIMMGYAPQTLGIGYEVQLVDWVYNPDPTNYVVVSSKETVPLDMAAPLVVAAKGHWCLFLRKENLKMFLEPAVIDDQLGVISDGALSGTIAEVEYAGYTALGGKVSLSGRIGIVEGRGRLCVHIKTGELQMMETPEKGWMFVEEKRLEGGRIETTIPSLHAWAEEKGIPIVSASATSITLKTPKAKTLGKNIDKWDFFNVEIEEDTLLVSY